MTKKQYSPISFRVDVSTRFRALAQSIGMENTEALQVVMAAYDIINNTRYGEYFSDATHKALAEITKIE